MISHANTAGSRLAWPEGANRVPSAGVSHARSRVRTVWEQVRAFLTLRNSVLSALVLTYVWRFHDLTPVLQPFRLAALASVASWCLLFAAPGLTRLGTAARIPYVKLVTLWFVWVGITAWWALDPDVAWDIWVDGHLKTLAFFLFLLTCVVSLESLRAVMALNVLGAGVLTFYYVKGKFPLWGSPVPMYDVNDLALHLNIVLPMTLFFAMSARKGKLKLGLWALIGLMVVSVLMTQSRAGFLTVGVLTLLLLMRARSVWVKLLPPICLVLGFGFLPEAPRERLSTLFSPTEDYNYTDEGGRVEIWRRGMGYLSEHPVTGVGASNFPIAEARLGIGGNRVAHNSFLEVAVETGYVGFALYVSAVLLMFWRLIRLRRRMTKLARTVPAASSFALAADTITMSLAAFCVNGFFLAQGFAPVLFTVVAMAAGLELAALRWSAAAGARGARPSAPAWPPAARVHRTGPVA